MKTRKQNRTHRNKLTELQPSEFLTDEPIIYNREKTMVLTNSTVKLVTYMQKTMHIVISHIIKSNSKRSNDFTLIIFV
jgi:hypothetical protein